MKYTAGCGKIKRKNAGGAAKGTGAIFMQWTAGQQAAIEARNDSVLVSAAAGSGKTAVLVERVLSLLREGKRIDRMLIVTFTRAAAGEMRERIGRRLEEAGAEDAHLRRQAMRLSRAAICTLHVFCARLLREHFEAVGLDPLFKIADEERLRPLRQRALDETLEAAYAAPSEEERQLFSQFEDQQIAELMQQCHHFLLAQADPWGFAQAQTGEAAESLARWTPLLERLCADQLEGAAELLPALEQILHQGDGPARYAPALECDQALTEQLLLDARAGKLRGGKTAFARLSTKKAGPEESPESAARFKALREEWKKRVQLARDLLPQDEARAEADLRHTLPPLRALLSLTQKMDERFFALKQQKNYLDYSDLEHLSLRALSDPAVRSQTAGKFDALFIDEYQDISGIQEAILQALHQGAGNLLFMVGDVKQSIYRFRLADPTLFLRKYQEYSLAPDAPERKILLQQNFRSDENVLLAVNQVFRHAMREKETEIAYDEAAMLRPGGGQPLGAPVEIHVLAAQEEDGEEGELSQGYRHEAAFVARRIQQLMREATVREGKGVRPLRFRDIALLLRNASGRAPHIARALQLAGVPVYSDADAQFYDLPEVADLLNLLRAVDNPLQDLPLLAALRCPCFDFSEEELARVRLVNRAPGTPFHRAFRALMEKEEPLAQKARGAWDTLARWRFLSRNLPVDQLVWRVLEESGLYMRAGALPEGETRQANLRLLAERAQGEAARQGLGPFLRETGRISGGDDGKSAKALGENEDVVRILTLHKSKGLEFPVVFLLETARNFRLGESGPLLLHAKHGAALQYIDGERRLTRETCAQAALRGVGEKEARAEEARLLYVGMTRARERLILVGSPRRLSAAREKWARPATAYAAGSAACMLDWVMESLGGLREGQFLAENGSVWQGFVHQAEAFSLPAEAHMPPPPLLDMPADAKTTARLERTPSAQPPLKTSVTAIAKALRQAGDDWESPADKGAQAPAALSAPSLRAPELTPAQRGVITHRALGLVDYAAVRAGDWAGALDALCRRGALSPAERESVQLSWLRRFFESPLGRRALAAEETHREWAFNLRGQGQTLIQGVIDLCFLEEGAWVLTDYKTDRAEEAELLSRYALQLNWYARALASITGRPVREMYLFSLRAGRAIPVEPLPETAFQLCAMGAAAPEK